MEEEKKKITLKEFEKEVKAFVGKGLTAEKIGDKLRAKGLYAKDFGVKISRILKEDYSSPDLKNIEEKLERVKKHYLENKQDKRAKREQVRIFAQLRTLKKYLKIPVR